MPAKPTKSKSVKSESAGELTLAFDFDAPAPVAVPAKAVVPSAAKSPAAATKKPKSKAVATAGKAVVAPVREKPLAPTPEPAVKITEPATTAAKKTGAPKAKRVRVPENLAEQYGAKLSKRVESGAVEVPTEDTPKKRLSKAEREARKQLLRPDDGLLQRLQRAANIVPAKRPARQKGWKFDCGRCGRTSYFQTPSAGICECGAIAVKE